MELADGGHLTAGVSEAVAEAFGFVSGVGMGVVPVAGFVGVAAGDEVGPRGHADGVIDVGVVEAHAALSETVEVGGLNERMAVAAGHATGVLVGHEDEEVHGF